MNKLYNITFNLSEKDIADVDSNHTPKHGNKGQSGKEGSSGVVLVLERMKFTT